MSILAAFALLVFGGVVLAVSGAIDLPAGLVIAGLLAAVVGVVTLVVLTYHDARREHVSVARAFGRALKTGGRTILEFVFM